MQKYTLDLGDSTGTDGESGGSAGSDDSSSGLAWEEGLAAATRRAVRQLRQSTARLVVKLRNVDYLSLRQLKEIAAAAKKQGKEPWLDVDTMEAAGQVVDVRVGLAPSLAEFGKNMAASTRGRRAGKNRALFEKYFFNEIVQVICLSQKEDFGQTAILCVRLPEKIEADKLVYYAYNQKTNSYSRIEKSNAWLDANGYTHFGCPYGGTSSSL